MENSKFVFQVTKKGKKAKDPIKHELNTVHDIIHALDEKNIEKFLKDFKSYLLLSVNVKEMLKSQLKLKGLDYNKEEVKYSMTWIED